MLRNLSIVLVCLCLFGFNYEGGWNVGEIPAKGITVNTDNFDNNLDSTDDTAQKAFDTLDDLEIDFSPYVPYTGATQEVDLGSQYLVSQGVTIDGEFLKTGSYSAPTGGTKITDGLYTVHTFTEDGTFTSTASANVEYLVVAGGGGAGQYSGGGGGGGMLAGNGYAVTAQTYSITVGAGGNGGTAPSNGGDSIFSTITATGGGKGNASSKGSDGGSGGGAGSAGSVLAASAGVVGQGNNGGVNNNIAPGYASGGGGGAGAVGGNASSQVGGNGGAGTASSISGSSVTYAGGGGGGTRSGTAGTGGAGGGGAGSVGTATATSGTANTGGGGGGGGSTGSGGSGGSGIVVIRYLTSDFQAENSVIVTSTGLVGIGTTTPTAQLDVVGSSTVSGNLNVDSDTGKLLLGDTQDASITYDGSDMVFDSQEVGTGDFVFSGGNVGIGTASPSYKLSVASTDGSDQIGIYHDNTNAYMKWTDGSLFLMTDEANSGTTLIMRPTGAGTEQGSLIGLQDSGGTSRLEMFSGFTGYHTPSGVIRAPNGHLSLQPDANDNIHMFTIATAGETKELLVFGYRTGDEKRSLQIGVGIDAADTASFDGVSNYYFDGNMGIGTASPSQALDLIGSLELEDTTSSTTGVIYKGSSPFIHNFHSPTSSGGAIPTGYNTFVGINAGNFTMGSTATETFHGSYNVGVGENSLNDNTIGYQNTAIGYGSLAINTEGYYNSAVGNGAMGLNTTGYHNTAIGMNSGRYIANGSTANTTSRSSTYLGSFVKALASGGTNEIVIGYNATGLGSNTAVLGNDSITTTALKGDVGIGTTTPSAELEVDGNIYANDDVHIGGSPSQAVTSDADLYVKGNLEVDGAVWLGDASADTLTVAGAMAFTGDTTFAGSVLVSDQVTIGGDLQVNETIVLEDTVSATTGVIYKGTDRFIHNYQHPTGGGAVPVGRNTFAGVNAGNFTMGSTATQTSHGSYNSAMGYASLLSNTTGYRNSAMGYASLYGNTTGYQNNAMGYQSLYSNTTGYQNNAMGYQSLYSNTEGYQNSALGYTSLYSNTAGYSNSAMGYYSLFGNTTGSSNSAIGYASLLSNTTGYSNSAMGLNAGRFIANGTTANQTSNTSVYLGALTKALANGDTNEIVIGYAATGLGSNTAVLGNDSITTTGLRGNVGIGTTSPSQALDLIGSLELEDTTTSTTGVIYKGANSFIHNFSHPTGNTAIPIGRNTFLGVNAGNFTMGSTATSALHASYNSVFGYGAFINNTIGYGNTAFGYNTLLNNTEGNYNLALGSIALSDNTVGDYNVALGREAAENIEGSYNIAMGYRALEGVDDGAAGCSYNIAFGHQVGDDIIANSNYNILMGYNLDLLVAGDDDKLIIGKTDPTIYGDMTDKKIGINTTTLTANLNVEGGVRFGDETNEALFAADGELTLTGTARVYKNQWITVSGLKVPGTKPATYIDWGINGAYEFSNATDDTVVTTIRLPQDMDKTVAPEFKVGFASDTNSGDVVWQLEYLYISPNEDTTASAQETLTTTTAISGTANGLTIATITGIDLPSSTDQLLSLRIKRLGADASDTLADDVAFVGAGLKYVSDKLGIAL